MTNQPEHAVKEWVARFGIAVPRGVTGGDPSRLTPPLVVKAYGPGLVHKSDAGSVRLNLPSAEAAAQAAAEMRAALTAQGIAVDGFLVEEQAEPGVEVIVGAVRDPAFGPVVLAGLGGVWTEVLHDTALRLAPLTEADARGMLDELRGRALLDGFRGQPPIDRDALVKVLLAVSEIAVTSGFAEFELNPVICGPKGAIAVDARLIGEFDQAPEPVPEVPDTDFGPLFAPRGVAVVGASTRKPNFGNMFLGFYRAAGFAGSLVAVHPEASEIDGVPCVPSLADVPEGTDYALVAVPARQCPDVVRQAAGIPYVQVMSGGFREMGEPELEAALLAAAEEAGVRLLGPNCMGVYSPAGGQTFLGGEQGAPGRISVISQSGGMAGEVIKVGERRGLRFGQVATVGNSADVTPAELLRYMGRDSSAIGLYLEDPRDGRGLFETLRRLPAPVVALVGGRSGQGRQAAASHTGGMVSDTRIWNALTAQTGLAVVTSQDDLIGVLDFFDQHAARPAPGSPEVLVVGPSGGASVLAADVFDGAGLSLAALPEAAVTALRGLGLGAGSSLANPLEIPVGPRGVPDFVRTTVRSILEHRPYADVVTHVNAQSFFTFGSAGTGATDALLAYTSAVAALQGDFPATRVTLVIRNAECAPPGVEESVREVARGGGVPVYRSMEAAVVAIGAGKTYSVHRSGRIH